jgi:hypothetical protein
MASETLQLTSQAIQPPVSMDEIHQLICTVLPIDRERLLHRDAVYERRDSDARGHYHRFLYTLRYPDCVIELHVHAWERTLGPRRQTRTIESLYVVFGSQEHPQVFRRYKPDTLKHLSRLLSPS